MNEHQQSVKDLNHKQHQIHQRSSVLQNKPRRMSERREINVRESQESQEGMRSNSQTFPNQIVEAFHNGSTRMRSWFCGKEDESKKEELIRSTQSLHHYIHKYFNITNRLSEILNIQMNQNILPAVSANKSESIEQNCVRVRRVMSQIIGLCEREDKLVQKSLEPALYEKIAFSVGSLEEKAAVIKDVHDKNMGVLGNVFCPVVTVQLARSNLTDVMPPVELLKSQPVSSFVLLGDLEQSSKLITKLLCGSQNHQTSLDETIQLMQDLLSILRPPCDSYNDILCEVEAYVKIISKKM
ncbi:single-pass membrane and coiled-coil domain-containing protein 3-like isoform X1 [Misgurnus anguillicaudatus]|uniref:single-pass membrane and coiled-coil domain-containing protein 3-like isoform X1 n=2 Tax=Misgurnus anguillicaudatus TaxID=75329 RepID=UPI003CCFC229